MKKHYLLSTLLLTALLSAHTTAFSSENPNERAATKSLILAIDNQNVAGHFVRTDTYTSQYEQNSLVQTSLKATLDPISKSLKNMSRALKRITSVRYGKSKKIRAKLGVTSLTLRYTHTL